MAIILQTLRCLSLHLATISSQQPAHRESVIAPANFYPRGQGRSFCGQQPNLRLESGMLQTEACSIIVSPMCPTSDDHHRCKFINGQFIFSIHLT